MKRELQNSKTSAAKKRYVQDRREEKQRDKKMNNVVFVSFLVLTISISHFGVSGQYIQYNANAKKVQSAADRKIDTATAAASAQVEYEYYDDFIDDLSTTQLPSTTTTTTTTPKPITSYRFLTTHRNGFRPINLNKKRFEATTKQYQPDSYIEASNESAFIQNSQNSNQLKQLATPQLRNAIAEVNRRTIGKEYVNEKSAVSSNELNGNGSFSRRYARFLFKLRSG